MSRNRRIAFTLCSLAGLSTLWSGCSAAKQTELVAGVSTQVKVPRDIRTVRVDVTRNGAPFLCRAYRVYDGKVLLPRTLGTIPAGSTSDAITISITGFTAAESEPGFNAFTDECLVSPGVSKDRSEGGGARVLRRARLPYDPDVIRFVPMPLRYSCFDKECDPNNTGEKTCKAGQCVDAGIDVTTLKKYSDGLALGTDSSCFSPKVCFPDPGVPAQVIDPDNCIYAVPNTKSAPTPGTDLKIPNTGDGVNVRVVYDGGFSKEILDLDKDEGFFIPDPNFPQRFQLSPGLCALAQPQLPTSDVPHRISAVQTFGFCQPKLASQPICATEANKIMTGDEGGVAPDSSAGAECKAWELKPSKNALLVLAETSSNMTSFYGQADFASTIQEQLRDPGLERTSVALKFLPSSGVACGAETGLATPTRPFKFATDAALDIASDLAAASTNTSVPGNMFYDLAFKAGGVYSLLTDPSLAVDIRRAVVIGSHGFVSSCGGDLKALVDAAATGAKPIVTEAILVGGTDASALGDAKSAFGELHVTDARTSSVDPGEIANANKAAVVTFARVASELTSCTYDTPAALASEPDPTSAPAFFYERLNGKVHSFSYNAACTSPDEKSPINGWGFNADKTRVFFCGTACSEARAVRFQDAQIAATDKIHAQPIPIYTAVQCGSNPLGL